MPEEKKQISLETLYKYFLAHPEGKWIMRWEHAQELYDFLIAHPVKKVLELGTGIGCSTAIMALALQEVGAEFEIHTVEQYESCQKIANAIIPPELFQGKGKVYPYLADPVVWQHPQIKYDFFMNFERLPEGEFDFILVDGPGPWLDGDQLVELPNGDVMRLLNENKLKPGCLIAWDGRLAALRLLERFFGDNFYLLNPSVKTDFFILERKDNPIQLKDVKVETMKKLGYFKEAKKEEVKTN